MELFPLYILFWKQTLLSPTSHTSHSDLFLLIGKKTMLLHV